MQSLFDGLSGVQPAMSDVAPFDSVDGGQDLTSRGGSKKLISDAFQEDGSRYEMVFQKLLRLSSVWILDASKNQICLQGEMLFSQRSTVLSHWSSDVCVASSPRVGFDRETESFQEFVFMHAYLAITADLSPSSALEDLVTCVCTRRISETRDKLSDYSLSLLPKVAEVAGIENSLNVRINNTCHVVYLHNPVQPNFLQFQRFSQDHVEDWCGLSWFPSGFPNILCLVCHAFMVRVWPKPMDSSRTSGTMTINRSLMTAWLYGFKEQLYCVVFSHESGGLRYLFGDFAQEFRKCFYMKRTYNFTC